MHVLATEMEFLIAVLNKPVKRVIRIFYSVTKITKWGANPIITLFLITI